MFKLKANAKVIFFYVLQHVYTDFLRFFLQKKKKGKNYLSIPNKIINFVNRLNLPNKNNL